MFIGYVKLENNNVKDVKYVFTIALYWSNENLIIVDDFSAIYKKFNLYIIYTLFCVEGIE